jgi:hypothetical protein
MDFRAITTGDHIGEELFPGLEVLSGMDER